jgi:GIY-YIG catalytic domain-containing protein
MAERRKKSRDEPPFETHELRKSLKAFFKLPYTDDTTGKTRAIGSFKWGVYIFYDYDGEPIYVGQTKEKISGRIGRHLTNQRTDAVAMSVLDPFEVYEIEVYPLPQFEEVNARHLDFNYAKSVLDALEFAVHGRAVRESKFHAILNEKDPPAPMVEVALPKPLRGCVVTLEVKKLRSHRDVRIARRAQIVARLGQTISEREVQNGLRRTLVTQATRLQNLAAVRFEELGGAATVERGAEDAENKEGES